MKGQCAILSRRPAISGVVVAALALAGWQRATAAEPPAPLFADNAPLVVTLEGPIDAIVNDRRDEAPYRPVMLRYFDASIGSEVSLDAGLRTRGRFRRDPTTCTFPPLRINVRKKQAEGTLFEGQDKLKLVTHCRSGDRFVGHLVNEYLAYRTLNVLTDRSLRVRFLTVRYVMTDRDGEVLERHAFLLEPEAQMAARHGARVREAVRLGHGQLDPQYSNLIEMFQFMIANTDWSMIRGDQPDDCCHNFILITADDELYYSVPYDFDFSGVVNAPYAAPDASIKIRTVRQRIYRGRCRPDSVLAGTVAHFNAARPAIYALYQDHPVLGSKRAAETLKYYDKFYTIINDPKQTRRHIENRCIS